MRRHAFVARGLLQLLCLASVGDVGVLTPVPLPADEGVALPADEGLALPADEGIALCFMFLKNVPGPAPSLVLPPACRVVISSVRAVCAGLVGGVIILRRAPRGPAPGIILLALRCVSVSLLLLVCRGRCGFLLVISSNEGEVECIISSLS